jgi:hypothetical protein
LDVYEVKAGPVDERSAISRTIAIGVGHADDAYGRRMPFMLLLVDQLRIGRAAAFNRPSDTAAMSLHFLSAN